MFMYALLFIGLAALFSVEEISANNVLTISDSANKSDLQLSDEPNLQRFYVFNAEVTFFEAWQKCRDRGLQLATIRSVEDSEALQQVFERSIAAGYYFWVAGTELGQSKSWLWLTTGRAVGHETGYTNWDRNEPAEVYEGCMEVKNDLGVKWGNIHCRMTQGFICAEYEEESTSPTDPTDTTVTTDPTDSPSSTEPVSPTDPTDTTDSAESTEPTEPTSPTDPTDTTITSDPTDLTSPTEPPPRYHVIEDKVSFFEAWHECHDRGLQLAAIRSAADSEALYQELQRPSVMAFYYWIAGTELGLLNSWLWITTGRGVGYTNWDINEPSEKNRGCLEIRNTADVNWSSYDCSYKQGFICEEYEKESTNPTDPTDTTITTDPTDSTSPTEPVAPTDPTDTTVSTDPTDSTETTHPTDTTVTPVSTTTPSGPPNPFQRFFIYDGQSTFFEAWQLCRERGLRLATIRSALDNTALGRQFDNSDVTGMYFWIAGTDLGRSRHWLWITTNRAIGHITGYTNWNVGEPNNDFEHCIEVYNQPGTGWNDRECHFRRGFVCENF